MLDTVELLQKYNQPTPRYTSYPPAPHWRPASGDILLSALGRSTSPLSIYVHIPFCERLCLYCGCNVVVSRDHSVASPYLSLLVQEMDLLAPAHGRPVNQIHWGGGTPTFLDAGQLRSLFNAFAARFKVSKDAEISIEIDPRVTTRQQLEVLRELGFNRLSLGIQDFDTDVQQTIRRIQPFEQTRDAFAHARALGFDGVNADLIYGLPRQTRDSFSRTLDQVLCLAPDRLSVFSYAHVPTLKRQQKALEPFLPGESDKLELFELAVDRLTAAGYVFIGIDHFALPGDPLVEARDNGSLHRNFQGYTTHGEADLLGFGVSAIGAVAGTFTQNPRELGAYTAAIAEGRLPVFRGYHRTRDDQIRGAVIETWLCHGRIEKEDIERRFGIVFDSYFQPEIELLEDFEHDGLLEGRKTRRIRATSAGRVFMRAAARVFDAFQPAAVASGTV
jgi:oxygen-independent coproporphyrinogen-3 oxidase